MAQETSNAEQSRFQKAMNSNGYAMAMKGIGGIADQFPTPNADLNSNNQMAAQARAGISDALMSTGNPYAMAAGAAVKILDKTGGFSDVSEGLGQGTDMGNAAMSFLLPGAGYFLPKTNTYKMSADMQAMQNAYQGSMLDGNTAMSNSGAKLWFGRGKANGMIADAQNRDNLIKGIKRQSDDDYLMMATMTQNRAMSNAYNLAGGYNQSFARIGRLGLKLRQMQESDDEVIILKTTPEQDNEFFNNLFKDEITSFQKGGKTGEKKESDEERIARLVKDVIEPAAKSGNKTAMRLMDLDQNYYIFTPNDIEIIKQKYPNSDVKVGDKGNVFLGSITEDNVGYLVPEIQYVDNVLQFVPNDSEKSDKNQWIEFPSEEDAIFFGENYHNFPNLIPVLKNPIYLQPEEYKNGGTLRIRMADGTGYVTVESIDKDQAAGRKPIGRNKKGLIYLNGDCLGVYAQPKKEEGGVVEEFKEGGQMNVIPEGSLHARLHHMENADELTKKGIPVVDNDGHQQAEIEHSEIIFNLDTTKKFEELHKKFKSDEYTAKEKENFAIEAGKLLAAEIMENTDDRVGLINTI